MEETVDSSQQPTPEPEKPAKVSHSEAISVGVMILGVVVVALCAVVTLDKDIREAVFGDEDAQETIVVRQGERSIDNDEIVDPGSVPTTEDVQADDVADSSDDTTTADPDAVAANSSYENDFINMEVLAGWELSEASNYAVNITNGSYILYISPNASQASGIIGGRFSEIAVGAPGADLVVLMHPNGYCGTSESRPAGDKLTRNDLTVTKSEAAGSEICAGPSHDNRVWYFSYVVTNGDGFFGQVSDMNPSVTDPLRQFVITMTYDADSIDDLPLMGAGMHRDTEPTDDELEQMLEDMTEMVESIEFKQ